MNKQVVFVKMTFFRKFGKDDLCSEGNKLAFSLTPSVLGKCHFCDHIKSPNTTKIVVSAGTGENPNGPFGCKSAFLGRGFERGFTLCDA